MLPDQPDAITNHHQIYSSVGIFHAKRNHAAAKYSLIPAAKVGHIGLYRDEETLKTVEYFCKLPQDIAEREVIVVDPMLATGGSAADALTLLKERGAKNLRLACLISSPEGIKAVQEAHPDVDIYVASIDEQLNEKGYIVPGLGDAGDRLFGTK